MKECISIKTDYSLLSSMIKLPDLFLYAKNNGFNTLGIVDNNLNYVAEFYKLCRQFNIKGIIGLEIKYLDGYLYLYAKNYMGYKKLLEINTCVIDNNFNLDLIDDNLLVVVPYEYMELFKIDGCFIGYKNDDERQCALKLSDNIIYFNIVLGLDYKSVKFVNYLKMIDKGLTYDNYNDIDYRDNVIWGKDVSFFTNLIDVKLEYNDSLIPHFSEDINDSFDYLKKLAFMGLNKRCKGNVSSLYIDRLNYELDVINKMNYVDYFLIVYDYVKFAVKNGIYVGPGRGSAVGSLVTYCLGITSIDPLEYDLLFERFLNPDRLTMPDIDIDFDADKRNLVIDYVKEKYGFLNVLPVMTYGTMASKLALLSVSRILNVDISSLNKFIDAKKSLKDNLSSECIKFLNSNKDIKEVYYGAMMIEGIKKHIGTNAAGVVICKYRLDSVIPLIKSGNDYLTGFTKDYLEDIGLLKMDFLSIKNLTLVSNVLDDIPDKIDLNKIDLDDKMVYDAFAKGLTSGIFQFDTKGMNYLLSKIKPSSFNDLVVALGLIRPGANNYIDLYVKRKFGVEKVKYIDDSLKDILEETYGIIIYQEQIMNIFRKVASYSYSEADLIRRAISKKNENIILGEKEKFISRAVRNGYLKEKAELIFDDILKFALYGFNKSHSVGYARLAYQMMYLKVNYPLYFYRNLFNISTRVQYCDLFNEVKFFDIKLIKPDVNMSSTSFIVDDGIVLPLDIIKNISKNVCEEISNNKPYDSFYDFVAKVNVNIVNKDVISSLVYAGALDCFGYNRCTLINNLDSAFIYSDLVKGLDSKLVSVPFINNFDEYNMSVLMEKEYEMYGFYLSNHPSSKYNCPKSNIINSYFDKVVNVYGFVNNIRVVNTKKGDKMAFLSFNDDRGNIDLTVFPKNMRLVDNLKKGDFVEVNGQVQKRFDRYQIVVNNIKLIKF